MAKQRIILLVFLGAVFLLLGLYYRIYEPVRSNISYGYFGLGIGTLSAGLIFYAFFSKYKEIASLILGLVILHSGVVLLLVEKLSNPKLIGFLVFTCGIVVVLNSGFSDYIKRKKLKT